MPHGIGPNSSSAIAGRVLSVLRALHELGPGATSLAKLTQACRMPKSTVRRFMVEIEEAGYAQSSNSGAGAWFATMTPPLLPRRCGNSVAARALGVLTTLHHLGPGPVPLTALSAECSMSNSRTQRYLRAITAEGFAHPRGEQNWEAVRWQPAAVEALLVSPLATYSATASRRLRETRERTGQVVLLHSLVEVDTRLRVCTSADCTAGDGDFVRGLASDPRAQEALRTAPLDADAAGQVISAFLDPLTSLDDQRLVRVRGRGFARSPALLGGWDMLAVPIVRPVRGGRETAQAPYRTPTASRVTGALSVVGQPEEMTDQHWNTCLIALRTAARAYGEDMASRRHNGVAERWSA
ncbi:hypothetical protein QF035_009030 [Streptomyces umbrinus]|uniref:HTH iclR-type domain-containing protein n=2 Tax=Streptomyces umbrinus TaxID=67370 RepID=A0ABU0T6Y4_9ACTN|nr:hypothetical protein [Streptomyces umbrinus]